MITFEEARAKAAKLMDAPIKMCFEYEKAYRFNDGQESVGGFGDCVIIKETGEALTFVQFILNYHPEKNPRELHWA